MKNTTILKDELGLLKADKSAVLKELGTAIDRLDEVNKQIVIAEAELEEMGKTKIEESARLHDLRSRAISLDSEMGSASEQLRNAITHYESFRVKNAQEEKRHLGRIKEYNKEKDEIVEKIEELRKVYDSNASAFNLKVSNFNNRLRELKKDIGTHEGIKKVLVKDIESLRNEEKKLTKDRLKREDKIRQREKILELKELSLNKKEEDLENMIRDIIIVYDRLKVIYEKEHPGTDLDKLITIP